MIVLGIESSCDETAAALVEDGARILSSIVASQVQVHAEFGGVVPELASREHVDNICFVVKQCLNQASLDWDDVDAVSVTQGPGLVGALLVGLAYSKALAYARNLPFLGVNHLEGHMYSIFLDHPDAQTPALSLVISGGHTNLYYLRQVGDYELLAKSRDDAAGEALDKLSKFLGLGYPGGPIIERLAPRGDSQAVPFTLPKITSGSLDFSFSGIKTAALRHIKQKPIAPLKPEAVSDTTLVPPEILDLLASFQQAIVAQVIDRLRKALPGRQVESIHISGGVSCNQYLRRQVSESFLRRESLAVYYPQPALTTDNAAMIAAAAYQRLKVGQVDSWDLAADPNLKLQGERSQPQ
jgi:N6-L-threonylcarbamoyladenine synthase